MRNICKLHSPKATSNLIQTRTWSAGCWGWTLYQRRSKSVENVKFDPKLLLQNRHT